MALVSVIIPLYNSEKHLSEAVESALYQTYTPLEIILVDDGSTDSTAALAREYAAKHSRKIVYMRQDNKGPGAARNTGMRKAQGDYIAFLDADDVWLPEKLEKQVASLERDHSLGFVYCDNYFVDEKRSVIPNYQRAYRLNRGFIVRDLFKHCAILTSSAVVRRNCADNTGYFREEIRVGEDYDFFLRLSYRYPAEFINEKLFERREVEGSLSRRSYLVNGTNDLYLLKEFLKEHPEFYGHYKDEIIQRLSDYHFQLGYHCLTDGLNARGLLHLIRSSQYKITPKTIKCILLSMIPFKWVRPLKEYLHNRRRHDLIQDKREQEKPEGAVEE